MNRCLLVFKSSVSIVISFKLQRYHRSRTVFIKQFNQKSTKNNENARFKTFRKTHISNSYCQKNTASPQSQHSLYQIVNLKNKSSMFITCFFIEPACVEFDLVATFGRSVYVRAAVRACGRAPVRICPDHIFLMLYENSK